MKKNTPRYLKQHIISDLGKKIVLLGGPRQVGKTTLSKGLAENTYYLNYDVPNDRQIIKNQTWPKNSGLLVLDELHKLPKWKSYLKGIADDEQEKPRILVTGSAKLDTIKKVGDSLAGRYLYWKLHPLCIKELKGIIPPEIVLEKILNQSGFPEPFYEAEEFYPRWAKTHLDIILRQDLLDLERVSDILSIESLIELLSERVGQVTSYESLAEDLGKSPNTIKKWITLLENLFVIFRVTPFSKNIARSLLKSPKFFFFDTARVKGDVGAKFENLVACALVKEVDYINDSLGASLRLQYLRNREGAEIDFAVTDKDKIYLLVEAKWADDEFAHGFKAFQKIRMKHQAEAVQVVAKLKKNIESSFGTKMVQASEWLMNIDFSKYGTTEKIRL
jgi:predicted AAA+ superfamily ATPase